MERDIDSVQALVGVASLNYLYRRLDNARALLGLAQHLAPESRSVKEFLTVVLVEMGDYPGALSIIRSLEREGQVLAEEIAAVKSHVVAVLRAAA